MSLPTRSTPKLSPAWPSSGTASARSLQAIRDRDYLLDRHGVIFKVIGDVHPDSHYLGYVKYHPDGKGDRRLFGKTYRQNSVVSKSLGSWPTGPSAMSTRKSLAASSLVYWNVSTSYLANLTR